MAADASARAAWIETVRAAYRTYYDPVRDANVPTASFEAYVALVRPSGGWLYATALEDAGPDARLAALAVPREDEPGGSMYDLCRLVLEAPHMARCVLLGGAASGKTSAMRKLAFLAAERAAADAKQPVPVLVFLVELAKLMQRPSVVDFPSFFEARYPGAEGRFLAGEARRGALFLLLDGMDETGRVKGKVEALAAAALAACPRAVLSSRPSGFSFDAFAGLPCVRLLPMPAAARGRLAGAILASDPTRLEAFTSSVLRWPGCAALGEVPLLFTLLAVLFAERGGSGWRPANRWELMSAAASLMARRAAPEMEGDEVLALCQELAHDAHVRRTKDFDEDDIDRLGLSDEWHGPGGMPRPGQPAAAAGGKAPPLIRTGLLTCVLQERQRNVYRFEWLTARRLLGTLREALGEGGAPSPDRLRLTLESSVGPLLNDYWYREVLLMAASGMGEATFRHTVAWVLEGRDTETEGEDGDGAGPGSPAGPAHDHVGWWAAEEGGRRGGGAGGGDEAAGAAGAGARAAERFLVLRLLSERFLAAGAGAASAPAASKSAARGGPEAAARARRVTAALMHPAAPIREAALAELKGTPGEVPRVARALGDAARTRLPWFLYGPIELSVEDAGARAAAAHVAGCLRVAPPDAMASLCRAVADPSAPASLRRAAAHALGRIAFPEASECSPRLRPSLRSRGVGGGRRRRRGGGDGYGGGRVGRGGGRSAAGEVAEAEGADAWGRAEAAALAGRLLSSSGAAAAAGGGPSCPRGSRRGRRRRCAGRSGTIRTRPCAARRHAPWGPSAPSSPRPSACALIRAAPAQLSKSWAQELANVDGEGEAAVRAAKSDALRLLAAHPRAAAAAAALEERLEDRDVEVRLASVRGLLAFGRPPPRLFASLLAFAGHTDWRATRRAPRRSARADGAAGGVCRNLRAAACALAAEAHEAMKAPRPALENPAPAPAPRPGRGRRPARPAGERGGGRRGADSAQALAAMGYGDAVLPTLVAAIGGAGGDEAAEAALEAAATLAGLPPGPSPAPPPPAWATPRPRPPAGDEAAAGARAAAEAALAAARDGEAPWAARAQAAAALVEILPRLCPAPPARHRPSPAPPPPPSPPDWAMRGACLDALAGLPAALLPPAAGAPTPPPRPCPSPAAPSPSPTTRTGARLGAPLAALGRLGVRSQERAAGGGAVAHAAMGALVAGAARGAPLAGGLLARLAAWSRDEQPSGGWRARWGAGAGGAGAGSAGALEALAALLEDESRAVRAAALRGLEGMRAETAEAAAWLASGPLRAGSRPLRAFAYAAAARHCAAAGADGARAAGALAGALGAPAVARAPGDEEGLEAYYARATLFGTRPPPGPGPAPGA
eukprot:tig00001628_g9427.t1